MTVVTQDGVRRRMPAGTCWIGPRDAAPAAEVVVQWTERGVHYTGLISAQDLAAGLSGCLLQYT